MIFLLCGSRDIYFCTLIKPHIKLQIFCENFEENPDFSDFFPHKSVTFVSICTQNGKFPNFLEKLHQMS